MYLTLRHVGCQHQLSLLFYDSFGLLGPCCLGLGGKVDPQKPALPLD